MANPQKAVADNVAGDFFVDTTCINCDTCRQLAPMVFRDSGDFSAVFSQPQTDAEVVAATRALLCCPTGSIGTRAHNKAKEVIDEFPLLIEDDVFYSGFNSPNSYGGNSFFIQRAEGNWLIDSPKYLPHLVKKFKAMGGIEYIFLTHRDDVADAAKFAQEFNSKRIIHSRELSSQPDSEIVIEGEETSSFEDAFTIIPVPGHTSGHMVLLYKNKFLFTGDHLHFDRETGRLESFPDHCWYSWGEQIKSMQKLIDYDFEWVLAGHGDRAKVSRPDVRNQLEELVERMKLQSSRRS